jgi:drug/metabolite transporter (DMT)-like permease
MRPRDLAELMLLAALWGGSFLAMRVAAPDFGPFALVFVRVAGASAVLLPLLLHRGQGPALRAHWRPIAIVGLTNSALPFLCFTVAALALNAGLSSIFNATTPLWAALIGWAWLHDRPGRGRLLGLAIGFAGVVFLAMGKASFKPGEHGVSPALAVLACCAAALLYGFSANFAKRHLTGVPPMALATGSQLSATAALALPAAWAWPAQGLPASSWWAAAVLAVACTALAYVLYFRLIAHTGPATASSVTFLIPAFAIAWGWMFLGETLSPAMLAGCGVILLGTALATGLLRWPQARARPV